MRTRTTFQHSSRIARSDTCNPIWWLGQVAYAMTKVGMTVLVHGLAEELKDSGVAITALWPATAIGSLCILCILFARPTD